MNVVEAYIKFNKQLVVVISGVSGCNKTAVAKRVASSLNLSFVNQFEFYNKEVESVKLPDGTTTPNFSTDSAVDWDSFNNEVLSKIEAGGGVIISAVSLPVFNNEENKKLIKFKTDYHIHLTMSKQQCIESRHRYLTKHKDKYPTEAKQIGSKLEKWKMNHITYPYYLESVKRMKIDKFITVKSHNDKELWSAVFDDIIYSLIVPFTEKFKNSPEYSYWKQQSHKVEVDQLNKVEEINSDQDQIIEYPDDEEFDLGEDLAIDVEPIVYTEEDTPN